MTAASAVCGSVAPGFDGVRTAFEQNAETGGAFAAMVDGELVVDLWGGVADPGTAELRSEDDDLRARSLLAALHEAVARR